MKVNKDNNATYGHEKKEQLKREIFQLFIDRKKDRSVPHHREVMGQLAYCMKVEPAYAKSLLRKYALKFEIPPHLVYKWLNRTL